ncbi:MAG: hypothetical protein LBU62_04975 [Bacteroidales bacterium]|nr:hypothetical protein [Bacteroidales bacterium]
MLQHTGRPIRTPTPRPAGTALSVPSLRDLGGMSAVSCVVRRLKSTVNKVPSLRDSNDPSVSEWQMQEVRRRDAIMGNYPEYFLDADKVISELAEELEISVIRNS